MTKIVLTMLINLHFIPLEFCDKISIYEIKLSKLGSILMEYKKKKQGTVHLKAYSYLKLKRRKNFLRQYYKKFNA